MRREGVSKKQIRFLEDSANREMEGMEVFWGLDIFNQKQSHFPRKKSEEQRGIGEWSITRSGKIVVQIFEKTTSFRKIGKWKSSKNLYPNIIIAEMEAVNNRAKPYHKVTIWNSEGARVLKKLANIFNKMDNTQYHPFRSVGQRSCWRVTPKGKELFLRAPSDNGGTKIPSVNILSIVCEKV